MWAKVATIARYLEELAPLGLALPGDPVGLQVGNPDADAGTVMVALELDEAVLKQAWITGPNWW